MSQHFIINRTHWPLGLLWEREKWCRWKLICPPSVRANSNLVWHSYHSAVPVHSYAIYQVCSSSLEVPLTFSGAEYRPSDMYLNKIPLPSCAGRFVRISTFKSGAKGIINGFHWMCLFGISWSAEFLLKYLRVGTKKIKWNALTSPFIFYSVTGFNFCYITCLNKSFQLRETEGPKPFSVKARRNRCFLPLWLFLDSWLTSGSPCTWTENRGQ